MYHNPKPPPVSLHYSVTVVVELYSDWVIQLLYLVRQSLLISCHPALVVSTCTHTANPQIKVLESSVEGFQVVKSEMERFRKSELRHVEPVVRNTLPTLESKPTTNHFCEWSEE